MKQKGCRGSKRFQILTVAGRLDPGSAPHLLGLLEPPCADPPRLEERQELFRGLDWI